MAARTLGELSPKRHALSNQTGDEAVTIKVMQRWLTVACALASGCVIERVTFSADDAGLASMDTGSDAVVDAQREADDAPIDAPIAIDTALDVPPPDAFAPPDAPPPDAFVCNDGDLRCNGDQVETCRGRLWSFTEDCALGCVTSGTPRCQPFVPSTVSTAEPRGELDLTLNGAAAGGPRGIYRIDTTDCTQVTGISGTALALPANTVRRVGDHCILSVRTLTVSGNNTLLGVGTRPLIVLATDSIVLEDTARITVSAITLVASDMVPTTGAFSREGAGAGSTTLGLGGPGMAGVDGGDGGGGGGGYCTAGAAGGDGVTAGTGGTAGGAWGVLGTETGAINRRQLRAGSRGGDGSPGTSTTGGRGGGGGGAVQLSAGRSLTINGQVFAIGGAGEGGSFRTGAGGAAAGAGGGGGSGGMILIEAPTVSVRDNSLFVGGGGGGGAACGVVDSGLVSGRDGTHGGTISNAAPGGPGGVCPMRRGGDGGDAASTARDADRGLASTNGGGGGAGAGCVSIRSRSGAAFPDAVVPRLPGVIATGPVIGL